MKMPLSSTLATSGEATEYGGRLVRAIPVGALLLDSLMLYCLFSGR